MDSPTYKFKRTLNTLWWLLVIAVCVVSAWVAVCAGDTHSAIREMATSAFGGAIVGALILAYEQFREEQREQIQWNRDVRQAQRLRSDANYEADVRSLADILLKELKPNYDTYFWHFTHSGNRAGVKHCDQFKEVQYTFVPLKQTCRYYVDRVENEELLVKWQKFNTITYDLRKKLLANQKKVRTFSDEEVKSDRDSADVAISELLRCSEQLLSQS